MDSVSQGLPPISPSPVTRAMNLATRVAGLAQSAREVTQLFEGACRLLVEWAPGALAWIGGFHPGDLHVRPLAQAGLGQSDLVAIAASLDVDPASAAIAALAVQRGTPEILLDLQTSRVPDPWREQALARGCRSAAALPLRCGNQTVGVLALYAPHPQLFEAEGLAFLQGIADHLGQGFCRLEAEDERLRQLRALEAIRNLTGQILSHENVEQLLHSIVQHAAALLEGSAAGMYLCQPEEQTVQCVVSHPTPPDFTGLVLRYGEGAAGLVAQSGEPLVIPDYPHWPGRLHALEHGAIPQALLSVPMVAQGEVKGVIHIWRSAQQPPFSQADLDVLSLFAAQAAVVLENARYLQASQARLQQLALLSEITRLALEARDPGPLLEAMVEPMARLVGADLCYITVWQGIPSWGDRPQGISTPSAVFSRDQIPLEDLAPLARFLSTPEVQVVADTQAHLDLDPQQASRGPVRSILALPLRAGGQHLGGVLFGFAAPHSFATEQISDLERAADLVALALSRSLSFEAERRRGAELDALRQANIHLTSQPDLQRVLEAILEQTIGLVGADDAHIFLFDGELLTFGAAWWSGRVRRGPYSTPRPSGLTYTVARTGQPIIVPDVDSHPLFQDRQWGGAIVGLPLRTGDETRGVMTVGFHQPRRFEESDLRPVELLADQAAIALENARLFEVTAAERRRIQLLYDITRALGTSLDPGEILHRATALTTGSLSGLMGAAFLYDSASGRLQLQSVAGRDPDQVPGLNAAIDARLGKGLVGAIAAKKEPTLVGDITSDSRWSDLCVLDREIHTALGAPILAGDELLGVLMVFHGEPSAYRQEQLDLLAAIARQVGQALTSASRHQLTRRRLAELTLLQQAGQVINRRLEMQPLLDEVVHQVREVLGYPVVEILLVEGEELVLRASSGSTYPAPNRMPLGEGMVGRVARTNRSAFASNVRLDPDYVPTLPTTQSEIVVPLRKGGVVFGVLNVESPQAGSLTEDDLRLLSLLADQMSVAIENAALYDHLRQHADELERTVTERTAKLAEALLQARQADRIKSQFVSDVSHELRTPLSNIRLYLDLLSMGKPDHFEGYVETLTRETERLMRLIEDLLAVSRLDAKASTMQLTPVDLNALAEGLVDDRRRLFAAKGLSLELQPQRDLPPVMADERMLSQVVANLLTNAMQYTPRGRVTISTSMRPLDGRLWATLTVADTGLGIPEDELPRLFERFFRGANSRAVRAPGTGLGLAICKEILERHGGRITVGSRVGHGSAFTIWLPAEQPRPGSSESSAQ